MMTDLHRLATVNAEAAADHFALAGEIMGTWGRAPAKYDFGLDAESDAKIAGL